MCINKKTTEQFKEEVYHLLGDEYTILGEYINNNTPIDIMHNICRNVDKVRPYSILGGRKCVYCSGRKKKTTKQFKEEVYNLVGDEYTILGEYKNNQTKIGIKHELCGHNYNVIPKHFLRGSRCAKCKGLLKKDTKQFKEEVYNLVGDEYDILEEYVNIKTKILIKHELCRTEYKVSPLNFLNGSRCPKCNGKMKKTTEQFKKEVYDLVGEDYIVLGDYVNAYTKIKIKHEDCGMEYLVRPNDFLRGSRCSKCSGNIKKTTEYFKKEVYNLVGDEYTVLGEYKNSKTKIRIKHELCGYEYEVNPSSFLRGVKCINCRIITTEQFKEEVYNLVGDEYSVLGDYVNNSIKVNIRHEICGYEYGIRRTDFLSGRRCPKCKGLLKKDTKQFKEEVYNLVGDEYDILGDYDNANTKIKLRHNVCKNIFLMFPNNFLRGSRCLYCSGNNKKTTKQFKEETYNLVGEEYTVLGEYENATKKIKMRHNICNNVYEVVAGDFLRGSRCYHCKESKGETKIRKYLNENMFKYLRECVIKSNRKCLRVDFMVIDNNNNYIAGIEYDGQHHYIPIDYFGGEKTLKQTQDRDKLKDEWFKNNNIKLIRIPYWEFKNIEFILKEELVNGNI